MCKCEKCGKEGKFFDEKEKWFFIPGVLGHIICYECFIAKTKEGANNGRNL